VNKHPWFKFYPADWIKGTRRLNLEQRAVLADLLAYMWENEPKGELYETGDQVGSMLGIGRLEAIAIVNQLVEKGVLTRLNICPKCDPGPFNEQGLVRIMSASCPHAFPQFVRIVSRRMSREYSANLNQIQRQRKRRESDRMRKKGARSASCHAPRTENVTPIESEVILNPIVPFEEFYNLYPRRQAKAVALKAWLSLKASRCLFEEKIRPALARQIASADWRKEGGKYIPLPATWIRGRRWEDEVYDTNQQEAPKGDQPWLQTQLTRKS